MFVCSSVYDSETLRLQHNGTFTEDFLVLTSLGLGTSCRDFDTSDYGIDFVTSDLGLGPHDIVVSFL